MTVNRMEPILQHLRRAVLNQDGAHLTDGQLRDVMRELFVAEAYRSDADPARAIVNAELKAGDWALVVATEHTRACSTKAAAINETRLGPRWRDRLPGHAMLGIHVMRRRS